MDVAALMHTGTVKVPLEAFDKEEAIAELVELLVRNGKIADRDATVQALLDREDKGSTGIGGGIALPHAKTPDIHGVVMAVGVSPDGIEFDAVDDEPVHLVFLVIAESHNPEPNVQTLASIGCLMEEPGVYADMCSARSAADLIRIVQSVQEEQ